jgi:hypothetical protein
MLPVKNIWANCLPGSVSIKTKQYENIFHLDTSFLAERHELFFNSHLLIFNHESFNYS